MKTAITAVTAGVVGIVIGAGGWALLGPDDSPKADTAGHSSATTARPAAGPKKQHYTSAQAIADKMTAAGLVVTMVHEDTSDNYISDTGGKSYDLGISEKTGQQIGDSGINIFPNDKALTAWAGISQSMGGIAVTGDTWAVSLPSSSEDRAITNRMAPKIAKALGGTITR
jgi:hypothetical protein